MQTPISNGCGIIGCFRKLKTCDKPGLTCQCCEIITCVPKRPTEPVLINGRRKLFLHQEDKNIIHLSRVRFVIK